jgi:RNA recognition motif. (a.k.a. RRM, RBD, or RNP domain)
MGGIIEGAQAEIGKTHRGIINNTNSKGIIKTSMMIEVRGTCTLITQVGFSCSFRLCIGNNVYVAGIPKRISEDDLRRVFVKFGPIKDIKVIKDPQTNCSKGFAYILYENIEDANKAIE